MERERRLKLRENPEAYRKWLDKCNEWKRKRYKETGCKKNYRENAKRYYYNHIFNRLCKEANRSVKRLENPLRVKPFDLWKLAKRQRCKCFLTGVDLTKENISLDHIVPVSRGGNNNIENLRLVIKSANIAKQAMSDQEFISLCRLVVSFNS